MYARFPAGLILLILIQGCSSLSTRMALPMVESQVASINEEIDPVLAEQAIPASLKMLEGLLRWVFTGNKEVFVVLACIFRSPMDEVTECQLFDRK